MFGAIKIYDIELDIIGGFCFVLFFFKQKNPIQTNVKKSKVKSNFSNKSQTVRLYQFGVFYMHELVDSQLFYEKQ